MRCIVDVENLVIRKITPQYCLCQARTRLCRDITKLLHN